MAYRYTTMIYDKENGWSQVAKSTSDSGAVYEDFIDAPIKNVSGKSRQAFINISGLSYGSYNLYGFYKLDSSSVINNTDGNYFTITIYKDSITNKKTAIFNTIEGEAVIQHLVVFNENNLVEKETVKNLSEMFWEEF